jgi:SAM-dependent methyltransferase
MRGQLRRLLGLRQTFIIDGIRYRERSPEPLRRALSRKGSGFKEYDVQFRHGRPLRIRVTAGRTFADLTGPRLLPVYMRCADWLTPGLRIVVIGGGTGYAAAWIAQRVGPSGAVVSLDPDEDSITFARRRYPLANVAFEVGGIEALSGETDGAFDAAIAVESLGSDSAPAHAATQHHDPTKHDTRLAVMTELWRIVGTPGWLYIAEPVSGPQENGSSPAAALGAALRAAVRPVAEAPPVDADPAKHSRPLAHTAVNISEGWVHLLARRAEEA